MPVLGLHLGVVWLLKKAGEKGCAFDSDFIISIITLSVCPIVIVKFYGYIIPDRDVALRISMGSI